MHWDLLERLVDYDDLVVAAFRYHDWSYGAATANSHDLINRMKQMPPMQMLQPPRCAQMTQVQCAP